MEQAEDLSNVSVTTCLLRYMLFECLTKAIAVWLMEQTEGLSHEYNPVCCTACFHVPATMLPCCICLLAQQPDVLAQKEHKC